MRERAVIHQAKVPSTPADIAAELAQVPTCRRILFETGRMAPMLYHGLTKLGLPVVCVDTAFGPAAARYPTTSARSRASGRAPRICVGSKLPA